MKYFPFTPTSFSIQFPRWIFCEKKEKKKSTTQRAYGLKEVDGGVGVEEDTIVSINK
jgi:hypothetical protein